MHIRRYKSSVTILRIPNDPISRHDQWFTMSSISSYALCFSGSQAWSIQCCHLRFLQPSAYHVVHANWQEIFEAFDRLPNRDPDLSSNPTQRTIADVNAVQESGSKKVVARETESRA